MPGVTSPVLKQGVMMVLIVRHTSAQIARADEAETVFLTCFNCDKERLLYSKERLLYRRDGIEAACCAHNHYATVLFRNKAVHSR